MDKEKIVSPDGIRVLSLYDGMSCAMLALIKAGIPVSEYIAYEIDKYAVKTSLHNFPFAKHMGDVFHADYSQIGKIDLLAGGSPCFVAGTMVKTIDRIKPIEEIQVGDLVLTHKGRYRPVKEVMSRLVDKTVVVKCENCGKVECTPEHPFYAKNVVRKWSAEHKKSTRKLNDSFIWLDPAHFQLTRNCSNTIVSQTYLTTVSDNISLIPHYDGVNLMNNKFTSYREKTLNLADESFWYLVGRWIGDGWFAYKYKKQKIKKLSGIKICCGRSKVFEFEKKLNKAGFHYTKSEERTVVKYQICHLELALFLEQFGSGAANKYLTDTVFNLPSNLALAFLQGYFESDGHIDGHICSFSTVSKELAYGIKYMINKYCKTSCSISMNNKVPNVIEGRKVNVRNSYVGMFHMQERKQAHYFTCGQYIFAPYKKVEYLTGDKLVYNLAVEEDESYTANGLVVHNCTYWSVCKTSGRETEASGLGWELFQQYVRAVNEVKPEYFIYENNKSMSPAIRESIDKAFGFEAACINSALVSAQNRQRLYWVGRRNEDGTYSKVDVSQPEDRGVLLKDVLDKTGSKDLSEKEMEYMIRTVRGGAKSL